MSLRREREVLRRGSPIINHSCRIGGAVVWIQEVVVVGASGVMVAGVEVVVIGVNREGGQRRGEIGGGREEIGRTTNGLEVKKMVGRVRTG